MDREFIEWLLRPGQELQPEMAPLRQLGQPSSEPPTTALVQGSPGVSSTEAPSPAAGPSSGLIPSSESLMHSAHGYPPGPTPSQPN